MKGIKPDQFVEILAFIQRYHKFALWLDDKQKMELQNKHPNMTEHGFNIKYVDSIYDSRFGDIWQVSFRGMGINNYFHTNTDLKLPYDNLFDWVMAFLKKEWAPTKEQEKSITENNKP